MPATYFSPSRFPVGGVPAVSALQTVASPASTLIRGALVVQDVTGLIDTCGDDPLLIAGVALQAASTNPGYSAANSPTVITGRSNKVSTAVANNTTQFMARLTNASNTTVAPTAADLNVQYGVTKQTTDEWTVDKSKVGATARVVVVGIDTDNNRVFVKFLPAYFQL